MQHSDLWFWVRCAASLKNILHIIWNTVDDSLGSIKGDLSALPVLFFSNDTSGFNSIYTVIWWQRLESRKIYWKIKTLIKMCRAYECILGFYTSSCSSNNAIFCSVGQMLNAFSQLVFFCRSHAGFMTLWAPKVGPDWATHPSARQSVVCTVPAWEPEHRALATPFDLAGRYWFSFCSCPCPSFSRHCQRHCPAFQQRGREAWIFSRK